MECERSGLTTCTRGGQAKLKWPKKGVQVKRRLSPRFQREEETGAGEKSRPYRQVKQKKASAHPGGRIDGALASRHRKRKIRELQCQSIKYAKRDKMRMTTELLTRIRKTVKYDGRYDGPKEKDGYEKSKSPGHMWKKKKREPRQDQPRGGKRRRVWTTVRNRFT